GGRLRRARLRRDGVRPSAPPAAAHALGAMAQGERAEPRRAALAARLEVPCVDRRRREVHARGLGGRGPAPAAALRRDSDVVRGRRPGPRAPSPPPLALAGVVPPAGVADAADRRVLLSARPGPAGRYGPLPARRLCLG